MSHAPAIYIKHHKITFQTQKCSSNECVTPCYPNILIDLRDLNPETLTESSRNCRCLGLNLAWGCLILSDMEWCAGWWFGTFFMFPYIGNNNPYWRTHIFKRASYHIEMEWYGTPTIDHVFLQKPWGSQVGLFYAKRERQQTACYSSRSHSFPKGLDRESEVQCYLVRGNKGRHPQWFSGWNTLW